ncbi:MAG: hypothetical protein AAF429_09310 [Pseudomonadota bacterium]
MKTLTKHLALATLLATVAAPLAAMTDAQIARLATMGFDKEVILSLSEDDRDKIERALNDGSDSDARGKVNSILLNAMVMEMMKK